MKLHLIALPVACALALGCATARAQEGPPPGGQPPAPEGRDAKRPPADPARLAAMDEAIAKAEAAARDAKARLDQLTQVEKRAEDDATVRDAMKHARMAQAHLERMRAERDRMAHGGPPRRPGGFGDAGPNWSDERGPRGPMRGEGPGPGRPDGPPGSVEERLERVEHAVHELRALLDRHNVPPEVRERAERRMREMHGPRPGPDGRRGPPDGPHAGPRGPHDGPPPPHARGEGRDGPPPMPPFRMDDADEAKVRAFVESQQQGARRALDEARREMETMRAELQRARDELHKAQEELAKSQAEIEKLRSGK